MKEISEELGEKLARTKIRSGYIWYWCGFGLIIVAFAMVVIGLFIEEGFNAFVIGRIIFSLCAGSGFMITGRQLITKARQGVFCKGCRFVRWDNDKGVWYCVCPQPPKYDQQRCYSRERK